VVSKLLSMALQNWSHFYSVFNFTIRHI